MNVITNNKRSVMTLYSEQMDIYCHQVRIVLAEKGVNVDILDMTMEEDPRELLELNPYNSVPTLVDRDLVIYQARIIMEYLDERFPHPPLMPVYPVARAESRRLMYQLQRDLYTLVDIFEDESDPEVLAEARKKLQDTLVSLSPMFARQPYFMSDEFTLVDCCFAPILWRLPLYGIELPPQASHLQKYADKVFERNAFQVSLTEAERELRD